MDGIALGHGPLLGGMPVAGNALHAPAVGPGLRGLKFKKNREPLNHAEFCPQTTIWSMFVFLVRRIHDIGFNYEMCLERTPSLRFPS